MRSPVSALPMSSFAKVKTSRNILTPCPNPPSLAQSRVNLALAEN